MKDYEIVGLIGPVGVAAGLIAATALVTLIVVSPVVVGAARRLAEGVGQMVEARLKPSLFPPRSLDLLTLQRRIVLVALRDVTVSVAGKRYMARNIAVQVSPSDHWRLSAEIDGGLDRVTMDLVTEVGRRAAKLGYEVPADMTVAVLQSGFAVDGRPTGASQSKQAMQRTSVTPAIEKSPELSTPKPAVAPKINLEGETRLGATRKWVDPEPPRAKDGTLDAGADTVNMEEATLLSEVGTEVRRIVGRLTTVGRGGSGRPVDLAIPHASVSSDHAEFVCDRGIWSIEDRGSRNGTYVDGERVRHHRLTDGDRIQFSSDGPTYTFHLKVGARSDVAETQARRS